jgi:hypothetical protein
LPHKTHAPQTQQLAKKKWYTTKIGRRGKFAPFPSKNPI